MAESPPAGAPLDDSYAALGLVRAESEAWLWRNGPKIQARMREVGPDDPQVQAAVAQFTRILKRYEEADTEMLARRVAPGLVALALASES